MHVCLGGSGACAGRVMQASIQHSLARELSLERIAAAAWQAAGATAPRPPWPARTGMCCESGIGADVSPPRVVGAVEASLQQRAALRTRAPSLVQMAAGARVAAQRARALLAAAGFAARARAGLQVLRLARAPPPAEVCGG